MDGSTLLGTGAAVALGLVPAFLAARHRWPTSGPSATRLDAVLEALAWAAPAYVPVAVGSTLPLLSVEELHRRWRRSEEELATASTTVQRLRVVEERQLLLEELERRDPAAVPGLDWDALLP
jgi:hypothetical protein